MSKLAQEVVKKRSKWQKQEDIGVPRSIMREKFKDGDAGLTRAIECGDVTETAIQGMKYYAYTTVTMGKSETTDILQSIKQAPRSNKHPNGKRKQRKANATKPKHKVTTKHNNCATREQTHNNTKTTNITQTQHDHTITLRKQRNDKCKTQHQPNTCRRCKAARRNKTKQHINTTNETHIQTT
jgi:hypothetical protein